MITCNKEWARNNFPVWHLIFSLLRLKRLLLAPVIPSQKLKIERLFLRFCSLRTNKYKPNLSAKQGRYHVPIPNVRVLALLFSVTLFACTGGGEDGTGLIEDNPSPSILSIGIINDGDAMTVNNISYQIDASRILVDGLSRSPEALTQGMVATVLGRISSENQAMADSIIVHTALAGPITHMDLSDQGIGSLDSLGQKILISESTLFDSAMAGIASQLELAIDDFIQVHGFTLSNGIIYATHLRFIDASSDEASTFYVTGVIHHLDMATETLTIGELKLDYSGVDQQTKLDVKNEQLVQVSSATPSTNQSPFFLIDQIHFIDPAALLKDSLENPRVVIQGIFEYDSSSVKKLNGQIVQHQDLAAGGGDSTNNNRPPATSAPSDALNAMTPVLTTSEGHFSSDGMFIIERVQ